MRSVRCDQRLAKYDKLDEIHVVPQYGKPHVASRTCWCGPREVELGLLIHEHREVA